MPDGFVANQPQTVIIEAGKKNVIKFENRFQRGIINLEKRGDIFTGNVSDEEEYETAVVEKGLEEAVYEVIACEDFTAYDGTFLQKSGAVSYTHLACRAGYDSGRQCGIIQDHGQIGLQCAFQRTGKSRKDGVHASMAET